MLPDLTGSVVLQLFSGLPLNQKSNGRQTDVPHAPRRSVPLTDPEKKISIRNALRYIPPKYHKQMAIEFAQELHKYGHIYMYRFQPLYRLRALPLHQIAAKSCHSAAIILMLLNNLDPNVAQFPDELVTYGGNGQVLSNWAQFWLVLKYLSEMEENQSLIISSGHPLGLFPSHPDAPRVIICNGMMIPNYSTKELYDKYFALNVTMYGQMTAGSYCYIGPQGIVHGTTITIKNAGRKYLRSESLTGRVFVTSGLGGMSGAQAKAAVIAGCIGVIAEVNRNALLKRFNQGWLDRYSEKLDEIVVLIKEYRSKALPVSIGYLGNIVDLWERLCEEPGQLLVDLGSDQTSCHNVFGGGYYPVGLSMQESDQMIADNPEKFKVFVQESLRRHIRAIDVLSAKGLHFWDYGNAFLLECQRAGVDVSIGDSNSITFKYPSYVQDIMGDVFSMGFGPFRWICTSGEAADLAVTDQIAIETMKKLAENHSSRLIQEQYRDNISWIEQAASHNLVVGSQARILYSDQEGRVALALAFNQAVADRKIKSAVVISRDHHDVSGTDSPYRETSNISDGSAFTADMAIHNVIGDAFRGATWVSIHNGGGVGWGEVVNGGFGLLLDGSKDSRRRAELMLNWDVANGVARRCWSGNQLAYDTIRRSMEIVHGLEVTLPYPLEDANLLEKALQLQDE